MTPPRRPGRPRNPSLWLVAIEHILTPAPRPWGNLKRLAYENGVEPSNVANRIRILRDRLREETLP